MAAEKRTPSQVKDALLHYVSQDIKNLQELQCDISSHEDGITSTNNRAQSLCEHLDCILLHGLYRNDTGYWFCVMQFTRKDAIKTISELTEVKTSIGKSRAWLNMALNEQVMESYLRTFIDNPDITKLFYNQEAFVRDKERLTLLITLVSGLDFVTFDLDLDKHYLNFRASLNKSSIDNGMNYDINPSFHSLVTPEMKRKEQLIHSTEEYCDVHRESDQQLTREESLFSSLPTSLTNSTTNNNRTVEYNNKEEPKRIEKEEGNKDDVVSKPANTLSSSLISSPPTSTSSTKQPLPDPPSFISRFKNLHEQEKELVDKEREKEKEDFVVSRQKKTKKKKKKKKKEEANDELVTTPTTNEESLDSIKENKPPIHSDKFMKSDEHVLSPEDIERDHGIITSVNHKVDENIPDLRELIKTETSPVIKRNEVEDLMQKETMKEKEEREDVLISTNPFGKESDTEEPLHHMTSSSEQLMTSSHDPMTSSHDPITLSHDPMTSSHDPMTSSHDPMTSSDRHVTSSPIIDHMTGSQVIERRERSDAVSSIDNPLTQSTPTTMTPPTKYTIPNLSLTSPITEDSKRYDAPPTRPAHITDFSKHECDLSFDNNTRVILSLDVYFDTSEDLKRLVLVQVPVGPGRYQTVILTITNEALYLIERDGTEGNYSRMMGIPYHSLEHIVIGLSWQSLGVVYREEQELKKQMIITGNEAVSRSIADTIRTTAVSVPLNRDDESRIEAIERELIKLGSETSMEVNRYCLVHWEQLSGDTPLFSPPADLGAPFSGYLHVKESNILMMSSWRLAYFSLIEGTLFHFNSEDEKSPKASYPLQGLSCGGCTRTSGETKEFAFTVVDSNGASLLLAAKDEEELSKWMQALCMSAIGQAISQSAPYSPTVHKGGSFCAVMITTNKVHVLHEDWSNESVHLISSISIEDFNNIGVDSNLPVYCTLTYDDWDNDSVGVWMLCFSSEYELGQFEAIFSETYKEIFQIEPQFSEVSDVAIKGRAEQALELMRATRERSDSLTKGRTEYTYSI